MNINNMFQKIYNIKILLRQIKYLKITTGFRMTWEEQLNELEKMGLRKSIIKRKKNLNDSTFTTCEMNNNNFGEHFNDLNRVSPTLKSDKYMMEAICQHLNLDGFGVKQVPSLWHLNNRFNAEIALCVSRGLLKVDPNNYYYNEHSKEYQDKMTIAKNIIKPIKSYDTVLIDYDTILENNMEKYIERIMNLYNKYHIILFTRKQMNDIHKINKKIHPIEQYILSIIYDANNKDLKSIEENIVIIYTNDSRIKDKYNIIKEFD